MENTEGQTVEWIQERTDYTSKLEDQTEKL